jgi:hypothetical protein
MSGGNCTDRNCENPVSQSFTEKMRELRREISSVSLCLCGEKMHLRIYLMGDIRIAEEFVGSKAEGAIPVKNLKSRTKWD